MILAKSPILLVPMLLFATSAAWSQAAPSNGTGISLDRFLDRQTGRIMAADTDGDGRVSRAEMAAMATKSGHDPARRFDAMDTNHDGYLDKSEIQAALTRRFHRMDRNGDGVVSPDERMAGRQHRQSEPATHAATPQS